MVVGRSVRVMVREGAGTTRKTMRINGIMRLVIRLGRENRQL